MAMRITTGMMTNNFLTNMNGNINRLVKYQNQLSTGQRMQKLSDDPVGIIRSLSARTKISRLSQHQENIDTGRAWLTQAETNLSELNDIIKKAYEYAVQITSDTYNPDDKAATASFIAQMRDHVLDLGNGQESELYIFGGHTTTQKPFAVGADGYITYKGYSMIGGVIPADEYTQEIKFEIGYEIYTNVTITGMNFMGEDDKNVYNLMHDFTEQLRHPNVDFDSLSHFITDFQNAQDRVLAQISDIGGRINRLDMMEARYATDTITYTDRMSEVADVDVAEAMMYFMMARTVYESSLNTGAQVLQNSLLNYLR